MKTIKSRRWLSIGTIIVLVMAIVGLLLWQKGSAYQVSNKETIKIGAIFPLTGTSGFYGEYYRQALDLASEEINKDGKIKVEMVYEDNQGDNEKTVTAYQKLSMDSSINIYLTTLSGATLAIAPLAEKDHHILFNLNSAAPSISEAGDYIFRNNLYPKSEIEKMVTFMNERGYKKVSTLMFNNDVGVEYSNILKNFMGSNINIVNQEYYDKGNTDFRSELIKIKSGNPDAVLIFAYANELGLIVNQSKGLSIKKPLLSFYTAEDQKVIDIASKNADDIVYTHTFDESAPMVVAFKNKLKDKYGSVNGGLFYSATAYDTLNILARSLGECPDRGVDCVKAELYKTKDYPGVAGITSIDKNGDTEKSIIMKTIKDGKFFPYGG